MIDFYTLSDKGIKDELGNRIKSFRLGKNTTQKELAAATMLSLNAIKALESGRGKLSTLIAVLRELSALDHLNHFIPQVSISPMQLARAQGKVRARASGKRKHKPKNDSQW